MADVFTPRKRSEVMSRIRGRDTGIEMKVRQLLHMRGLRFRLHRRDLPGTPDLVFPSLSAVVFIQGCFWHGHGCHLFRWPGTRPEFWRTKIATNRRNDAIALRKLRTGGWRAALVWECSLKGKERLPTEYVADHLKVWLLSSGRSLRVVGALK